MIDSNWLIPHVQASQQINTVIFYLAILFRGVEYHPKSDSRTFWQ